MNFFFANKKRFVDHKPKTLNKRFLTKRTYMHPTTKELVTNEGKVIIASDICQAEEIAKEIDPSLFVVREIPPTPPEGKGYWFRAYVITRDKDGKEVLPELKLYAYNPEDAKNMARRENAIYIIDNEPLTEVDTAVIKPKRASGN